MYFPFIAVRPNNWTDLTSSLNNAPILLDVLKFVADNYFLYNTQISFLQYIIRLLPKQTCR